jgi:hypothetical protein
MIIEMLFCMMKIKIILFLYFIAIPKKQNEKKSEIGFCSETDFFN